MRSPNRHGASPLLYASEGAPGSAWWDPAAQAAVLSHLIDNGADPNDRDKRGVSALHRAVRTRCADAVRTLLAMGADPRLPNGRGSTPLHLAVQTTGRGAAGEDAARSEQRAIIGLLMQSGARPTDKDGNGKSVADCASTEWVREALAFG